jgi:antitoxin component of MazEF toxin-antitoxin module
MQSVKARRQGNATVVTLPSVLKVTEGSEFYIIANEDGSILLIPKVANPYEAAVEQNAYLQQKDEWADVAPAGREVL